jgi:hypothetical protein
MVTKSSREHFNDDFIPKHCCLKLVAKSEQSLCGKTARLLLTYEKNEEYQTDDAVVNESLNHINFREK